MSINVDSIMQSSFYLEGVDHSLTPWIYNNENIGSDYTKTQYISKPSMSFKKMTYTHLIN